MPIYEYECCDCQHQFEKRQGFQDEPVKSCPQCQGKVRRLLRSVPVIFKGSGFYVTDNRGSNSASDSGKPADSKSGVPKELPPGPHKEGA